MLCCRHIVRTRGGVATKHLQGHQTSCSHMKHSRTGCPRSPRQSSQGTSRRAKLFVAGRPIEPAATRPVEAPPYNNRMMEISRRDQSPNEVEPDQRHGDHDRSQRRSQDVPDVPPRLPLPCFFLFHSHSSLLSLVTLALRITTTRPIAGFPGWRLCGPRLQVEGSL